MTYKKLYNKFKKFFFLIEFRSILIFLLTIFFCQFYFCIYFVNASLAAEFHISSFGNDSNTGSLSSPFLSFNRAITCIDTIRSKLPNEQITVWLHAGTYRFTKPNEFTSKISGSATAPVIFSAWPGERVILSGSTKLQFENFKKVIDQNILLRVIDPTSRENILQINLKELNIPDYGILSRHGFGPYQQLAKPPPVQLYINKRRLPLARWPNLDDKFPNLLSKVNAPRTGVVARDKTLDPGPQMNNTDFQTRGGTFSVNFDRLQYWTQADDIWLDGIFADSWEWSYNRVAKIDPLQRQITLEYGEIGGLPVRPKWSGDFFYAENLLEELDRPGEWYLDRKNETLYLYPPIEGFDRNSNIELATLNAPIFILNGTSRIIFRNLIFENGRGVALWVKGGEDVRVESCEIRNFSSGGINMQGRQHAVTASHLHELGGSAIVLDCGDKRTLQPGECFADDNHIHDWGWYNKVYSGAVSLAGVGQRVGHNHIHHAPHGAIYLSGNDHIIEYNDFHNLMETFIDMGIIYRGDAGEKPLERGHVIRRNYFHDIGQTFPAQHAVYPDNLTMGWTVEENLFARIGKANMSPPGSHAVHLNSTEYVTVRRNIFFDCQQPIVLDNYASRMFYPSARKAWERDIPPERLAKLPHIKHYPELANFWNEDHQPPTTNRFEKNLIWNPNTPLVDFSQPSTSTSISGVLDNLGALKSDGNVISKENPGITTVSSESFQFKPKRKLLQQIPNFPRFNIKDTGPRKRTGPFDGPNKKTQ